MSAAALRNYAAVGTPITGAAVFYRLRAWNSDLECPIDRRTRMSGTDYRDGPGAAAEVTREDAT
ncbi:hypothetical protein, partial [Nocardia cyriacigeorgica]|uniref:hypothetical protein n=1 Tax=Nocardia cyriacigeorgica TaxID=135487 RepID=UPI002456BB14